MSTTYNPRIPVDPEYVQAIGRAFYNFTYLEKIVFDLIYKLSGTSPPKGATASVVAKSFLNAIGNPIRTLPRKVQGRLRAFHGDFLAMKRKRDKLLHARPFTAVCGSQRLAAGEHDWTMENVYEAAKAFEDAAVCGSDLFHGGPAKTSQ